MPLSTTHIVILAIASRSIIVCYVVIQYDIKCLARSSKKVPAPAPTRSYIYCHGHNVIYILLWCIYIYICIYIDRRQQTAGSRQGISVYVIMLHLQSQQIPSSIWSLVGCDTLRTTYLYITIERKLTIQICSVNVHKVILFWWSLGSSFVHLFLLSSLQGHTSSGGNIHTDMHDIARSGKQENMNIE